MRCGEDSPSKRPRTDDKEDDVSPVEKILLEGKGNTLSVQQLREWLTDQALETTGLKRRIIFV